MIIEGLCGIIEVSMRITRVEGQNNIFIRSNNVGNSMYQESSKPTWDIRV